ncbi:hypothetical protein ACHAXT_006163 [Thalassiosira profunda]
MVSPALTLLALAPSVLCVEGFSPQPQALPARAISRATSTSTSHQPALASRLNARGDGFDLDDDGDVERDFVYAGRRSGRRGREEGGYPNDRQAASGSSGRLQDDVEFFDLDDDDAFEDEFDARSDAFEETYNGIIPNPLLDAMDPDGVYERLGPELFKDWTFYRDCALFAAFLAFFTRDTHHYGYFDSVVEGLERLPADFIS